MSVVTNVARGIYQALLRPEKLVQARSVKERTSFDERAVQVAELTVVYVLNLALYAGPLTAAGFGTERAPDTPRWFSNSGMPVSWELLYAFVQNSLFIFVATVLSFAVFHFTLVCSRQSKGFVRSAYVIIYSTSVYLAGIFTVVWYLTTNPRVSAARDLIIVAQERFVYSIIDLFGADLELPGGRSEPVSLSELSLEGEWLLSILGVLVAYYLYSLYLGARINHDTGRVVGVLVVVAVIVSPAIYVSALIIAYTTPSIPTL